jgi:hypothetical protein
MANYYYRDADNKEQGPYDKQQLQELAKQGIIKPSTMLATKQRYLGNAELFPGLVFQDGTVSKSGTELEQTSVEHSPGIFDIGFTRFVSNTIISIIWVICILAAVIACIGGVLVMMNGNAIMGIAMILLAPIALLFIRMTLELEVVIFRIESNTRVLSRIEEHLRVLREKSEK